MQHKVDISIPELGMIAGTRGLLGAGIGLLLADRFEEKTRKALGWTLLGVGALSTVPLALEVLGHRIEQKEIGASRREIESQSEVFAH